MAQFRHGVREEPGKVLRRALEGVRQAPGRPGLLALHALMFVLRPEAGFHWNFTDGPLTIKVPRGACNVVPLGAGLLSGPSLCVANWHHELSIKIDGDECRACSIVQGGGAYIQSVHVDLARHYGSAERCSARVSLSVQPVESLAAWEASSGNKVCQVARNGKCEPKGDWRRYAIGCAEDGMADGKKAHVPRSRPRRSRATPGQVFAYVTNALAWYVAI